MELVTYYQLRCCTYHDFLVSYVVDKVYLLFDVNDLPAYYDVNRILLCKVSLHFSALRSYKFSRNNAIIEKVAFSSICFYDVETQPIPAENSCGNLRLLAVILTWN